MLVFQVLGLELAAVAAGVLFAAGLVVFVA
jgi:hypothetical protein